jgi:hypothetical protein
MYVIYKVFTKISYTNVTYNLRKKIFIKNEKLNCKI